MLELLTVILFGWLFWKVLKLSFKLTWGIAKVFAVLLMICCWPVLIGCLIFAGGIVLLIPFILIAIVFGIIKACV